MAQLILTRILTPEIEPVLGELPITIRGTSGFGSTGIFSISVNSTDLGCDEPMVIPVSIGDITGSAMIDSGASTQFLDLDFAVKYKLPLDLKTNPDTLIVVDGREAETQLTHTCTLNLTIDQHLETLTFQVTKLAGWNMILGKTWLKKHNPVIDWARNSVTFASGYCQAHCLPTRTPSTSITDNLTNFGQQKIALISCAAFRYAIKVPESELFIMTMSAIQGKATEDLVKHPDYPANLVPKRYHDLLPLFAKKGADKLPPHRYVDHEIPIEGKPPMGRMYSMSASELQEVRIWIEENLSKGFIRASSSSCASPILFVKKKDTSLRLCVDYRALNEITIKDRYPLPHIEETLNHISGAKYFIRLDLRSAYNLI